MDWTPCKTFVRHMIDKFVEIELPGVAEAYKGDWLAALAGFEKFVDSELQANPVMHTGFDPAGMTVSFADGTVTLLSPSEPTTSNEFATAITIVTPRGLLQPDSSVPITQVHQRDRRIGIEGMMARPER